MVFVLIGVSVALLKLGGILPMKKSAVSGILRSICEKTATGLIFSFIIKTDLYPLALSVVMHVITPVAEREDNHKEHGKVGSAYLIDVNYTSIGHDLMWSALRGKSTEDITPRTRF